MFDFVSHLESGAKLIRTDIRACRQTVNQGGLTLSAMLG
jgi:hypothetical protein